MEGSTPWRRLGTALVVGVVVALIATGAYARSVAVSSASPITSPTLIKKLAEKAYVWGLAPEFVYRFLKYQTLVTAPVNSFGGGGTAAAWNNNAVNAGDASVLYLNAMIDLRGQSGRGGTKELVLTVPPSTTDYYVVNLLDDFIPWAASAPGPRHRQDRRPT
jgi:hypothetical protein